MIDLPSLSAIALAWWSAWCVEHPGVVSRGECYCNCSCETTVSQQPCPEGSWSWEFAKVILLLGVGIVLGSINLAATATIVFVKGVGLCISRLSAWASPTSLEPPSASPVALEAGIEHRELARRQLEAVRQRKATRA